MKIKYTGIKKKRSRGSGGCGSCGRRYSSSSSSITTYAYTHKMVLPSGKKYTFRLNGVYEIPDKIDYDFLTSFTYSLDGRTEHPFTAL